MRIPRFLTLVGLKHVGKTSVAVYLAHRIPGCLPVDVDHEMVSRAIAQGWFISEGSAPEDALREDATSAKSSHDGTSNAIGRSTIGSSTNVNELHRAVPAIRRLYRQLGSPAFAEWEADVITEILREGESDHRGRSRIIATGGGVCDNERAVTLLEAARPVFHLQEDPRVLYDRFTNTGIPAFLDRDDPYGSFQRLAERRMSLYAKLADQTIFVRGRSVAEVAHLVEESIENIQ